MRIPTAAWVAFWTLACTCQPDPAIQEAFREAEAEATGPADAVPTDWKPDAVLHLSPGLVDRLIEIGLQGTGTHKGTIDVGGGVELTPKLDVDSVKLSESDSCDTCLEALVKLSGKLKYKAGLLGSGSVPLQVDATADIDLLTERKKKKHVISAQAKKIRKVKLSLAGLPKAITKLAEEPVKNWADEELSKLEPTKLTEIGDAALPVRELRAMPDGSGLRVDLVTGAVHRGRVTTTTPQHTGDFQLDVSSQSLVWLARAAAFDLGPQSSLEVVGVPEKLMVKRDKFTLDLRLWRLAAPGWWRDYRVTGRVDIADGQAVLDPKNAEQLEASPGAGLADPLAFLAEGYIVDTLADLMHQSLPASESTTVEGWRAKVDVTKVTGTADGKTLQLTGDLQLTEKK